MNYNYVVNVANVGLLLAWSLEELSESRCDDLGISQDAEKVERKVFSS